MALEQRENGKPVLLNVKVQDTIVKLIELGNYITAACESAGISKKTFYNWLKRGEKGEEDVQMPEVPEIDAVPTTDAPPDRVQGEGVPGPGDGDRESVPGDQEGDPGVRELP